MFNITQPLSPKMTMLLKTLSPYVVVVGSICRGKLIPKDLDLIYGDSETALRRIQNIVFSSEIPFESSIIGHWSFRDTTKHGVQLIEILPFHYGKNYLACRRAGKIYDICGIDLVVAPANYSQSKEEYENGKRGT